MESVLTACRAAGCLVQTDAVLAGFTTFRIGGPADCLVTAGTAQQIGQVLSLCRDTALPCTVIGGGSNLLISDDGLRGVTLRVGLTDTAPAPQRQGDQLIVPAGLPLKQLCRLARDGCLAGLEFAYGIPGTVGGAVYMNAGAYGGETAEALAWAEVVTPAGETVRLNTEALNMSYRHSALMDTGGVVTRAAFRLVPGDSAVIGRRMDEFLARRREKQPLDYPSAGSYFKRPPGYYAGTLIESCGLKGFAVGGAQVSEKHAGFVVNRGGATCADVCRLERVVVERVWSMYGVQLEREVRRLGA